MVKLTLEFRSDFSFLLIRLVYIKIIFEVYFSGGAELLVGNIKKHEIELDNVQTCNSIRFLKSYQFVFCRNYLNRVCLFEREN